MHLRVHGTFGIHACSYKKVLCLFLKILLTDESHVSLDLISHNCVAQNSALVLPWLLAHPFCFARVFSQGWISLWAWKESSWSARYHWQLLLLPGDPCAAISCTLPAVIHPQGWGSGGQCHLSPPKWQVAGDPSRCLHCIIPSPQPPFARYYKMVNLAFPLLRRILLGVITRWHQKWQD